MNNFILILAQVIVAAWCFIAGTYIGRARNASSKAGQSWPLDGWVMAFDIATVALFVLFAIFVKEWVLVIILALIYRLVFTKTVNRWERGSFFFLDDSKTIDHFLTFALRLPGAGLRRTVTAGVMEVILLCAAILLLNWFFVLH